jgi:hypothetical protein
MPKMVSRWLIAIVAFVSCPSIAEENACSKVLRRLLPPQILLSTEAVKFLKGVVFQAEAKFIDTQGRNISPQKISFGSFDKKNGRLLLKYQGEEFAYPIVEDTFDRIFSWIENEGVGFFTARALTLQQLHDSGLRTISGNHQIAIEFYGVREIEEIATLLDFPEKSMFDCSWGNMSVIMSQCNAGLKPGEVDLDWIVSDLHSDFAVTLHDGKAIINGTLFRYHRVSSDNSERVFVHKVDRYLTPEELSLGAQMSQVASRSAAGVELARAVSMLRSLFRANPQEWQRFADEYFKQSIDHNIP